MAVRGSASYVWSEQERLGGGAFGDIYTARHRRRGTKYAVKVFKATLRPAYRHLKSREVALAQRLKHENIVRVFAIEEEKLTKDPVIIMELCEGDSLHTVLDKPENAHGLQEDYFLLLLRHMVAALRYMYEQKVVHRDIKPGNILIHITEDNAHVFKLTDFGGSHELGDEEEEFKSMFGTEEFLPPDVYQCALLGGGKGGRFSAAVDLWSLGVTLYQAATGKLPFRPHSGRSDRQMMYMLTSGKKSGVLSGVETEDGSIEWTEELPETCYLSRGLRSLLEPLLAGLMESDSKKQLTFQRFFQLTEDILDRERLHVFSALNCQHHCLYIKKDDKLPRLQDLLAHLTEVPARNQLLFHNYVRLEEQISERTPVHSYPQTCAQNPCILFPSAKPQDSYEPFVPELPTLSPPVNDTLAGDAKWAKNATAHTYYAAHSAAKLLLSQRLMKEALQSIRVHSQSVSKQTALKLELMSEEYNHVAQTMSFTTLLISRVRHQSCDMPGGCLVCLHRTHTEKLRAYVMQKDGILSLAAVPTEPRPEQCELLKKNHLQDDRSDQKMLLQQKEAERIWTLFKEHKSLVSISHNQGQVHKFERLQLRELVTKVERLYQGHCNVKLVDNYRALWKACQISLRRVAILHSKEKHATRLRDKLKCLTKDLNQMLPMAVPVLLHPSRDSGIETVTRGVVKSADYPRRQRMVESLRAPQSDPHPARQNSDRSIAGLNQREPVNEEHEPSAMTPCVEEITDPSPYPEGHIDNEPYQSIDNGTEDTNNSEPREPLNDANADSEGVVMNDGPFELQADSALAPRLYVDADLGQTNNGFTGEGFEDNSNYRDFASTAATVGSGYHPKKGAMEGPDTRPKESTPSIRGEPFHDDDSRANHMPRSRIRLRVIPFFGLPCLRAAASYEQVSSDFSSASGTSQSTMYSFVSGLPVTHPTDSVNTQPEQQPAAVNGHGPQSDELQNTNTALAFASEHLNTEEPYSIANATLCPALYNETRADPDPLYNDPPPSLCAEASRSAPTNGPPTAQSGDSAATQPTSELPVGSRAAVIPQAECECAAEERNGIRDETEDQYADMRRMMEGLHEIKTITDEIKYDLGRKPLCRDLKPPKPD